MFKAIWKFFERSARVSEDGHTMPAHMRPSKLSVIAEIVVFCIMVIWSIACIGLFVTVFPY